MKTINLNFPLTELSGEPLKHPTTKKEITAGEVLCNHLASDTQHREPVKFFSWALSMHKGEPIMIDDHDFKTLRDFVANHPVLTALIKAQILAVMDKA